MLQQFKEIFQKFTKPEDLLKTEKDTPSDETKDNEQSQIVKSETNYGIRKSWHSFE
jgi:hypothetical protein